MSTSTYVILIKLSNFKFLKKEKDLKSMQRDLKYAVGMFTWKFEIFRKLFRKHFKVSIVNDIN